MILDFPRLRAEANIVYICGFKLQDEHPIQEFPWILCGEARKLKTVQLLQDIREFQPSVSKN